MSSYLKIFTLSILVLLTACEESDKNSKGSPSGGSGDSGSTSKASFLAVANSGGTASTFKIQTNGTLGTATSIAAGTDPNNVTISPSGKWVSVVNYTSNNFHVYSMNSTTGALTLLSGYPAATPSNGGQSSFFHPTKAFFYVMSESGTNNLAVSSLSSSGVRTAVSGSPFAAGSFIVKTTPDGKFLYGGDYGAGRLYSFIINQTSGALTASGTAWGNATSVLGFDLSSDSAHLYAGSNGSGLHAFSISSLDGSLSAVSGSPFLSTKDFDTVYLDPLGSFVIAPCRSESNLYVFSRNSSTGVLTQVSGSPFSTAASPSSALFDPSGKYVYVLSSSGSGVYAYSFNRTTGAITALSGSPFPGAGPGWSMDVKEVTQ